MNSIDWMKLSAFQHELNNVVEQLLIQGLKYEGYQITFIKQYFEDRIKELNDKKE